MNQPSAKVLRGFTAPENCFQVFLYVLPVTVLDGPVERPVDTVLQCVLWFIAEQLFSMSRRPPGDKPEPACL